MFGFLFFLSFVLFFDNTISDSDILIDKNILSSLLNKKII